MEGMLPQQQQQQQEGKSSAAAASDGDHVRDCADVTKTHDSMIHDCVNREKAKRKKTNDHQ